MGSYIYTEQPFLNKKRHTHGEGWIQFKPIAVEKEEREGSIQTNSSWRGVGGQFKQMVMEKEHTTSSER